MKVLIADGVSQMAVDILKDEFECDVRDKLPADELLAIIPDYDALIVRLFTSMRKMKAVQILPTE